MSDRVQVTRYFTAENVRTGKKHFYAIIALDQQLGYAHVTFSKGINFHAFLLYFIL